MPDSNDERLFREAVVAITRLAAECSGGNMNSRQLLTRLDRELSLMRRDIDRWIEQAGDEADYDGY